MRERIEYGKKEKREKAYRDNVAGRCMLLRCCYAAALLQLKSRTSQCWSAVYVHPGSRCPGCRHRAFHARVPKMEETRYCEL